MAPRTDERFLGDFQFAHRFTDRPDIGAISPAAHCVHRAFYFVESNPAAAPEFAVVLMLERGNDLRQIMLESLQPHVAPARTHERRIGRARLVAEHLARPANRAQQQAAAAKYLAVAITIGRERARNDRFQFGRRTVCGLDRLKAAPRNTEHADLPVAPRLLRNPLQDFERIVLLLLHGEYALVAVGIAGAADIDAHCRIAMPRKVTVMHGVAWRVDVALAIRQHFDDRRHPFRCGNVGQPELGREPDAVGHRNPAILGDRILMRKLRDGFQRRDLLQN